MRFIFHSLGNTKGLTAQYGTSDGRKRRECFGPWVQPAITADRGLDPRPKDLKQTASNAKNLQNSEEIGSRSAGAS